MKPISATTISLIAAITTTPAAAFDIPTGKDQLETNCTACHGTDVYTRADKRINSRPALSARSTVAKLRKVLGGLMMR